MLAFTGMDSYDWLLYVVDWVYSSSVILLCALYCLHDEDC